MNKFLLLLLPIYLVTHECKQIDCAAHEVGTNFIKCYKFHHSESNESNEFSYVLIKGTTYFFKIAPGPGSTEFELFNEKRDRVIAAPNTVTSVQFNCNATGVYYLKCKEIKNCGGLTLSFRRT
jgi:hypothetical protein